MHENITKKLAALSTGVGLVLLCYMAYATIYGPYKTTFVHLAIFALCSFVALFLDSITQNMESKFGILKNSLLLVISVSVLGYFIIEFERLINLWGSTYLSSWDILLGGFFVIICIEASWRQSVVLGTLAIVACFYMLFGDYLPGIFLSLIHI